MVSSELRQLARQYNMKISHDVAYGEVQGYAASLREEPGQKLLFISARVPGEQQYSLRTLLEDATVKKEHRILNAGISGGGILVVLNGALGAKKHIAAFMDWFFPRLSRFSVGKMDTCPLCGQSITQGRWILQNNLASYVHEACAQGLRRELAEEQLAHSEEPQGSYGTGFLGALLGSVLGAVVWGIVLALGYMASLVGLLIGWLSGKGYDLCKGRQGKGKVAILIVAVIFGVLLGTALGDAFSLGQMIFAGELPGYTMKDIPVMLLVLATQAEGYWGATLSNVLIGLLFAGIGVFGLLRQTGKSVAAPKIIDLE